jgi:hypothetical protein
MVTPSRFQWFNPQLFEDVVNSRPFPRIHSPASHDELHERFRHTIVRCSFINPRSLAFEQMSSNVLNRLQLRIRLFLGEYLLMTEETTKKESWSFFDIESRLKRDIPALSSPKTKHQTGVANIQLDLHVQYHYTSPLIPGGVQAPKRAMGGCHC